MCPYSTEEQVYSVTGMSSSVVQRMGIISNTAVSNLINTYITTADQRIKHMMGIPYPVRKEYHVFHYNELQKELGPYEDEYGMFDNTDPTNLVTRVFAIYSGKMRMKLPYPKDCDLLTEVTTNYSAGANCTLTADSAIFKCGTKSIKSIKASIATNTIIFTYPSSLNLSKAIYTWDYLSFWFYASDEASTFSFELYDVNNNYMYKTFTVAVKNTWQIVSLKISEFTAGQAATVDWSKINLQYFKLKSSKIVTCYFDNFSFNDGLFWTTPEGLICWSRSESTAYDDEIQVTYEFDPYTLVTPSDIQIASAKLAGIQLLEYLIGNRQRATSFIQASNSLDSSPDRETLQFTKARLEREVEELLAGIGYKTYSGVGAE